MSVRLRKRTIVVGESELDISQEAATWLVRSLERTESFLKRQSYRDRLAGKGDRNATLIGMVQRLIEHLIGDRPDENADEHDGADVEAVWKADA